MGSSNPVAKAQDIAVGVRDKIADRTPDKVLNTAKTAAPFVVPGATPLSLIASQSAYDRGRGRSMADAPKQMIGNDIQTAMDVTGSDLGLVPDVPADPTAPLDDSTKTPNGRRKRTLDNRAGTILTGGGGTSGTLGDASGGKRSNLLGL